MEHRKPLEISLISWFYVFGAAGLNTKATQNQRGSDMDKPKMSIKRLTSINRFEAKKPVACPLCGNIGIAVKRVTVEHMVTEDVQINSGMDDFRICMNQDCDVVYYSEAPEIRLVKNQIRVPIWYKKDADPKYACNCGRVTEEQVIDAVVNRGAKTVIDINLITGAMKNSDCIHNNPLGICCHKLIQACIEKAYQGM